MGVVFEARQVSLNRRVALKVLSSGTIFSGSAIQRFRREAEAAAGLHHTNIVPIYATGEENGVYFYAMEFVEGPSLDQVIRRIEQQRTAANSGRTAAESNQRDSEPLAATIAFGGGPRDSMPASDNNRSAPEADGASFEAWASIVAEVAEGLHYAHQRGVIHRDIKPSNLLLSVSPDQADAGGSESAHGRLSISDFGLARILEQPGMTMTGEFIGTPAYMSPEQIAAGRVPIDHRTDIYSLGATLYELLTLRRPFAGRDRDQVLVQILRNDPVSPRTVDRKIPLDLETICLKAMEKDPARRYPTAAALADDLRRFANRFAIAARRAGPIERMQKWARRHPGVAVALIGVLILSVGIGFFADQARRIARDRILERRDGALEKALLLTFATDIAGAEKAIDEAEQLGASPTQLHVLQGQIALWFLYENEKAVRHLKQAVRLEPKNVSALSLLALAYLSSGQLDPFERTMADVRRLEPQTFEDFLHKGRVFVYMDRKLGLAMIDEAIRRRPSPFGFFVRAGARADMANDSGDPAMARLAIEDAMLAKSMLPDNPAVLDTSAYAHLAAMGIFQSAGLEREAMAARAQGEKDALALEGWVERRPEVAFNCAFFRLKLGSADRGLELLQKAAALRATSSTMLALACTLYREGKFSEGADVLFRYRTEQGLDPFLECCRAYIVLELPNGKAQAKRIYDDIVAQQPSGIARHFALVILLLLGDTDLASQGYQQELQRPEQWTSWFGFSPDHLHKFFEFGAGLATSEQLEAASGSSRWSQNTSQFLIALKRLSQGDREGAKTHLRKCLQSDNFFGPEAWWGQAFLERLDQDPAWPAWIPTAPNGAH